MNLRIGTLTILFLLVAFAGCSEIGILGPDVTDEDAKERALTAEEQYITEQLENASCVNSWSLNSYVNLEEQATVTNRTDKGVHVAVKHPYTYGTEQDDADGGTEAHYLVTPDEVDRINGTKLSPC